MADRLTKEERSRNMAAISGKNTKPELAVRKFLHGRGYRYSLHKKGLPGKPDIVLTKWKAAIFVNGCYWHRHNGCRHAYTPKSNVELWTEKFASNVKRDKENYSKLASSGWNVIIVWECEVKDDSYADWLEDRIKNICPTLGD